MANETRNETQNETAAILESLDIQSIWKIEKSNFDPLRARMTLYIYILRFKSQ